MLVQAKAVGELLSEAAYEAQGRSRKVAETLEQFPPRLPVVVEQTKRRVVHGCTNRGVGNCPGGTRVVGPRTKVSPNFITALLAREDARF